MPETAPTNLGTLVPFNGDELSAEDELAIPAIDDQFGVPVSDVPDTVPGPFGMSWQFDYESGRFVLLGGVPAVTADLATLDSLIANIVKTARLAHPIFSDQFGMDNPYVLIGEVFTPELAAEWQNQIVDALSIIDRITSIENFTFAVDDATVYVTFDYEIDNEQTSTINNIPLSF